MSLKAKVKGSVSYGSELLKVPAWDAEIEVRSMSVDDMVRLRKAMSSGEPSAELDGMVVCVLAGCYDPGSGELLFDDSDEEWVRSQPYDVVKLVSSKVINLVSAGADIGEAKKGS